jgi:hypothetical protein
LNALRFLVRLYDPLYILIRLSERSESAALLRLPLVEDAALLRYQNMKEQESHCILEPALKLEVELCPVFQFIAHAGQFFDLPHLVAIPPSVFFRCF